MRGGVSDGDGSSRGDEGDDVVRRMTFCDTRLSVCFRFFRTKGANRSQFQAVIVQAVGLQYRRKFTHFDAQRDTEMVLVARMRIFTHGWACELGRDAAMIGDDFADAEFVGWDFVSGAALFFDI